MFLLHILSNALITFYFTCSGSVQHSRTASLMRIFGLKYLLAVCDKELQMIADMNTVIQTRTNIRTHKHTRMHTKTHTYKILPHTHTQSDRWR